jgi:hypothetical protein
MMRVMTDRAAAAVTVVVGAGLSERVDKRYVVIDSATGAVVDDASGYGYTSAPNAHGAHADTSMAPTKKRQQHAAQRRVERWCAAHTQFVQRVEQAMFSALKDGQNLTEPDVRGMLGEDGLELPFSVNDLIRHRNW